MNHWESVKDRLPEVDEYGYSPTCLVHDGKCLGLATRYKSDEYDHWSESYYIGTAIDYNKIIHWMYLPKGPV